MNSIPRLLFALPLLLAAAVFAAGPLDKNAAAFLASYEKVRAALAADDLAAAQSAAQTLESAETLAKASSIGDARKAFKVLSGRAVILAKGRPGYYHLFCPMYPGGGDWVQTTKEIANPYFGKAMLRCGEIKD